MDPDLEKLIRLQRAETDLHRVGAERAEIPKSRSALEDRLTQDKARLEGARAALEASQKRRRQHEGGLQDLETKRSKYKGQLMEVKTNKEYTAVLHEIENVEREIRALEDQTLLEMERAESLAADLKREEGNFKTAEEQGRAERGTLEASARRLEEEFRRLEGERDAVAATIPDDALALFQRVARLRGVAVAEAGDGMCRLCHVRLRLQMYADLKKNEGIVQCPACSRILYYPPPVPAVSPEL